MQTAKVIASIMTNEGYTTTSDVEEADIVLINTCSIRENAEDTRKKTINEF